jgi:hypothetical protein
MRIQDCVESLYQKNVEMVRTRCQHLKKMKARDRSPLEFGWKVVVIGYESGLVSGAILGCVMNTRKYEWLVKNYFVSWQHKG